LPKTKRGEYIRHLISITKPGNLLKNSIQIRTLEGWVYKRSGFLEIDVVAHCGYSAAGLYLTTLTAVDMVSARSEFMEVRAKRAEPYPAKVPADDLPFER
jgi:hypothetical protein